MSAILRVENLRVEARTTAETWTPIVDGVSFEVGRHEVVALIGESGSGKTTTCLAAAGYVRPGCRIAAGQIWFGATEILSLDAKQRRRLRGAQIAYVAQSAAAAFNPALTIGSQVIETALIHDRMPAHEAERHAVALYRQLDLPDPERIGGRYPHQVSGGQLQRLLAAMAATSGPELLLLDEPTTALDVTTQIDVLRAFKRIVRERGTAAIYVSHDLAVVAQIADRIVVLHDGQLVEQAPTERILSTPRHDYTRRLLAAVRRPPQSADMERVAEDKKPPLIDVRGLSAAYAGARPVLHDVNLALPRGETVGVIGESGSGKSTLARVIAGLLPPAAGTMTCNGSVLAPDIRNRPRSDIKRIQIVFQMADTALNPRQRVRELLGRPLDLFVEADRASRNERIGAVLDLVELPRAFADRYPHELSGGQKQRVNLARALIAEPEVILCDEVISSLDTLVGAAILELLKSLQRRLGIAYLFISHDLSTVASFATRIAVLYAGRVVEQGATGDVLAPPYHPYTQLLLRSVPELRTGWLDQVTERARGAQEQSMSGRAVGCSFYARCPLAIADVCDRQPPPLIRLSSGHQISCHRSAAELD